MCGRKHLRKQPAKGKKKNTSGSGSEKEESNNPTEKKPVVLSVGPTTTTSAEDVRRNLARYSDPDAESDSESDSDSDDDNSLSIEGDSTGSKKGSGTSRITDFRPHRNRIWRPKHGVPEDDSEPEPDTQEAAAIRARINDLGGDKASMLKDVMVDHYDEYKNTGIYGNVPRDDAEDKQVRRDLAKVDEEEDFEEGGPSTTSSKSAPKSSHDEEVIDPASDISLNEDPVEHPKIPPKGQDKGLEEDLEEESIDDMLKGRIGSEEKPSEDEIPEEIVSSLPKRLEDEDAPDDDDLIVEGGGGGGGGAQANQQQPSVGPEPPSKAASEAMFWAGLATDVAGLTSIGNATMGLQEAFPYGEKKKEDFEKEHKDIKTAHGYINFASGLVSSGVSLASFFQTGNSVRNSHNTRKNNLASANMWKHGLGFFSNLLKTTNTGLKLWGDVKGNQQHKDAFNGIAILSSGLGLLSSAAGWIGSSEDKAARGKLIDKAGGMKLANKNDEDDAIETQSKAALDALDRRSAAFKTAKENHLALKSKKYAMQQAAAFHQIKKDQISKGAIGTITSTLTLASSIVQAIPKVGGGIVGSVLSAVTPLVGTLGGYIGKYSEKISDKRAESKINAKKQEIIESYLKKKRAKVRIQIRNAFRTHYFSEMISDTSNNELDRITIARMGINVKISQDDISEKDKIAAFEAHNLKQAKNIMDSGDRNKSQILRALHLKDNATLGEIASALKGD